MRTGPRACWLHCHRVAGTLGHAGEQLQDLCQIGRKHEPLRELERCGRAPNGRKLVSKPTVPARTSGPFFKRCRRRL